MQRVDRDHERAAVTDLWTWAALAAGVAAAGLCVAATPFEVTLGHLLKLVLFHGASTWVNLGTFTLAGVLAAAYLVNGRLGTYAYAAASRYVSFSLWILNTVLGGLAARLTWGPDFWSEPRLRVSFWILLAVAVAIALDIAMDKPKVHACLDIAIAVAVWVFVIATPKAIHPASPVLASGSDVKTVFAGMVLSLAVAAACAIRLWAARLRAQGIGVAGRPDEVD